MTIKKIWWKFFILEQFRVLYSFFLTFYAIFQLFLEYGLYAQAYRFMKTYS